MDGAKAHQNGTVVRSLLPPSLTTTSGPVRNNAETESVQRGALDRTLR